MQSNSPQWKQKRLREIDIACGVTLSIAVPAAIVFFTHAVFECGRYVDASNWTKVTAQVLSTGSARDFGDKYRQNVVVPMSVDGGREIVDALHSVSPKVADTMRSDLMKAGTVTVYRNKLDTKEYALSPV